VKCILNNGLRANQFLFLFLAEFSARSFMNAEEFKTTLFDY